MNNTHLPPGPQGLPFIGNGLQFQRNPLAFFRETQQRYPRIATVYVGKEPLILCFRPEHVRFILIENGRKFVKPNRGGLNLRFLLGDGLLTSDGDFHRQQRYTPRLAPGFPVILQPRITLRPKYGMRMILEPTTEKAVDAQAIL